MSYILEALNKSEQERRGQQTPDLNTVHRAPPVKKASRTPWLIIVTVLIVINMGGIGYWMYSTGSATESATESSTEGPTGASAANPSTSTTPSGTTNPAVNTDSKRSQSGRPSINTAAISLPSNQVAATTDNQAASQPSTPTGVSSQEKQDPNVQPETYQSSSNLDIEPGELLITPESAFTSSNQEAIRITELPLNVQRQIPDLVFSSHLYSSDASFRMVNINGKMMREGDMVANDLKLIEISTEGVILGYLHYVFEVSVLRDWSFN